MKDVSVHPTALVETDRVGPGTRIWAFTHLLEGCSVGMGCNICDHVFIEGGVTVGDNVTIKCGVHLWEGIHVENNVFIGPNATFTNDVYPRSKSYPESRPQTLIREGASIGAGAVLVAPVTIGRCAMVGAGAVVTKNVKDFQLVYGNPASARGYVCSCGKKMDFSDERKYTCSCGQRYTRSASGDVLIK